jgi:tetratricopeptide (TPR) repeat protein
MYGGMDRSKDPELKAADDKFVSAVTEHYGSRKKASQVWVEQGFRFYQQDKLGMAMRRFNQAWLLDLENPEAFAGFSAVLHDQEKYCDAMRMMEKALALNPPTFQGIFPDAGRIFTLCAVNDKTLSDEARGDLLARSEALFKKAEEIEPNKRYVYGIWATAYFWQGKYEDSWAMIAKERAAGGKSSERFLGMLRGKMPEPVRQ